MIETTPYGILQINQAYFLDILKQKQMLIKYK